MSVGNIDRNPGSLARSRIEPDGRLQESRSRAHIAQTIPVPHFLFFEPDPVIVDLQVHELSILLQMDLEIRATTVLGGIVHRFFKKQVKILSLLYI